MTNQPRESQIRARAEKARAPELTEALDWCNNWGPYAKGVLRPLGTILHDAYEAKDAEIEKLLSQLTEKDAVIAELVEVLKEAHDLLPSCDKIGGDKGDCRISKALNRAARRKP